MVNIILLNCVYDGYSTLSFDYTLHGVEISNANERTKGDDKWCHQCN